MGDVDVSWLAGRAAMAKRRRWNVYMPDDGTKFRDHLEAALMGSKPGRRVFGWLNSERESTEDGTIERTRVDHAYSHVLAFAAHNVPPGLNDEAIDSALTRAFLTAKSRSIDPHHIEIATRAFMDLYPDGAPYYSEKHPNGMVETPRASGQPGEWSNDVCPKTFFKTV